MSIRIFLSYSSKSKKLAHEISDGLQTFGFEVFVAHDAIRPAKAWRKEILEYLRKCDVFIPILTRGFVESDWTDQETGFALALKKTIIALKIHHQNPRGFLGDLQAMKWDSDSPYKTFWRIADCLHGEPDFKEEVQEGAISAFLTTNDFNEVGFAVSRLLEFRPFSRDQLHRIIEGSGTNQGIYGCWAARSPMRTLLNDAKGKVSNHIIRKYLRAVENW